MTDFMHAGLQFWKCPSRRLYAVKQGMKERVGSESARIILTDSEEEEDFECPPKKKPRKDASEKQLDSIMKDVSSIKDGIADMLSLQHSANRIPLGLLKIIRDSFKCCICHAVPMTPPVIVAKCCKSIVGCESCVNEWYSGIDALTKDCPKCRAERGYNETLLLRGLDDFLMQIREAIRDEDDN